LHRYEREFAILERRHSERSSNAAGHVYVAIKPFPAEMDDLMARMWGDLGGAMTATQLAEAKNLHFERYFPHSGRSPVKAEVWLENGGIHSIESEDPADGASSHAIVGGPMSERYRSLLQGN
jgi:hypothetical protein